MAGPAYQYQPKTYVLKFEEYPGLEVPCRGLAVGELFEAGKLGGKLTGGEPEIQDIRALFEFFVHHLIGWNLEQDGKPVPETVDALLALDADFAMKIVDGWMTNVTPGKSGTSSNGTATPDLEGSIPMSTASIPGT